MGSLCVSVPLTQCKEALEEPAKDTLLVSLRAVLQVCLKFRSLTCWGAGATILVRVLCSNFSLHLPQERKLSLVLLGRGVLVHELWRIAQSHHSDASIFLFRFYLLF